MAIGVCFLNKNTTLAAVILMFLQMAGTFLPLVILPDITFQDGNPLLPTLEGQYIIKNIIIITFNRNKNEIHIMFFMSKTR